MGFRGPRERAAGWLARFERWLCGRRAAVLAISHDPAFVARTFPRIWRLRDGRVAGYRQAGVLC